MKDKGLDKTSIVEFNTSDRNKRGWGKNFFGFRKMFWDYLNKLNVPFFDACCEDAPTAYYPVRWNADLTRLEYFNGTTWVDITAIEETTTTTSTTSTSTTSTSSSTTTTTTVEPTTTSTTTTTTVEPTTTSTTTTTTTP